MTHKIRLFLTAGDRIDWAVDEDLSHVRKALKDLVEFTDIASADIVFAIWWAPLSEIEEAQLSGKRVICFMNGESARFLSTPNHRSIFEKVHLWATRSKQATESLRVLGYEAVHVPYWANTAKFGVLAVDTPEIRSMVMQLGKIDGRYLIGNFMRDTEGMDINSPKLVKGPDMFAEIMREACRRNLPVTAVLGGPRRHWLRNRLDKFCVPYIYIGSLIQGDDLTQNTLSRTDINTLYNLVDLTIISSRSEGGPLAVCEAPMANCKIISTPVGMVPDALPPDAIFCTAVEAVDIIEADINDGVLDIALIKTLNTLHEKNSLDAISASLMSALNGLMDKPVLKSHTNKIHFQSPDIFTRCIRRAKREVTRFWPRKRVIKVGFAVPANGAYPKRKLMEILTKNGYIFPADKEIIPDIFFLNGLTDWPVTEQVALGRHLVILIDEPNDKNSFERLVKTLPLIFEHPSFVAAVVPTEALLCQLSNAGIVVKKPVLVPPLVDKKLFRSVPGTGKNMEAGHTSVLLGPSATSDDVLLLSKNKIHSDIQILCAVDIPAILDLGYINFINDIERAKAMQTCSVYVEFKTDGAALKRIREALTCGTPVVYSFQRDADRVVGFGGKSFDDVSSWLPALDVVLEQRQTYRDLIAVGSDDYKIWSNIVEAVAPL